MELSLTTEKDGETQRRVFTLTDDEIEALRLFTESIERVGDVARRVDMGTGSSMRLSVGAPVRAEGRLPDDELLAVFFHRMRMFLVKCERTFTPKIINILKKGMTPHMEARLNEIEDAYDNLPAGIQININGRNLLDHRGLGIWLNGSEYHWDADKRAILAEWSEVLDNDFLKSMWLYVLTSRFRIITHLNERYVLPMLEVIDTKQREVAPD